MFLKSIAERSTCKPITFRHSYKNSYYVIISEKHDESEVLNVSYEVYIAVNILFAALTSLS